MKNSNFKIGQRVAKLQGSLGYKVGSVKDVNDNLVLVDFDNHDNRWVSIKNLKIVSKF